MRVCNQSTDSVSPDTTLSRNCAGMAAMVSSYWLAVMPSPKAVSDERLSAIRRGSRSAMMADSAAHWSGCSAGFQAGWNSPPNP